VGFVSFIIQCSTFAQETVAVSGTVLTENGEVLQAVTVSLCADPTIRADGFRHYNEKAFLLFRS